MKVYLTNPPGTRFIRGAGDRWPTTRPPENKLPYRPFPFLLAYAAALLLREGVEVEFKDCAENGWDRPAFVEHVAGLKPDLVVMQTSTPSYGYDLETLRQLKVRVKAPVMAVGMHAGAEPAAHLRDGFDYVCRGEYEQPTLALVHRLAGDKGPVGDIPGVGTVIDGKIIDNGYAEPADLAGLPWPARHLLPMEKYCEPFAFGRNAWMMSTRGCPFACLYCSVPLFSGRPAFRTRDVGDVCDEMEHLIERYRIEDIYFDDASIAIDQDHLTRLCDEMIARRLKITWTGMVGPQLSDELLGLMAEAGCRGLKLGIESGCDSVLDVVSRKRTHGLDDVRRIIATAHRLGIKVMGTFMLGLPGENVAAARQTIDLMTSLGLDGCQYSIVTPFPGTKFYHLAREKGWLITEDWDLYDAHHALVSYPGYTNEDIEKVFLEMVLRWERHLALKNPRAIVRHLAGVYKRDGIMETARACLWGLNRLAGRF